MGLQSWRVRGFWIVSFGVVGCGAAEDADPGEGTARASFGAVPVLAAQAETTPLHGYDEAPRTPDADDPAIWVGSRPDQALILGALKEAGLQVYDLRGHVVQTITPPNRPPLTADDPRAPGPQPDAGTTACPESESGETYGRFNNVAVYYGFKTLRAGRAVKTDIAVVTDRGCDRLRVYAIEPGAAGGPLIDITAPEAPRAFPERFEQPSPLQSPGETPRVVANPLDDESTAYGLALHATPERQGLHAFVTQAGRSVVGQFALRATPSGVTYDKLREFRFDPVFQLRTEDGDRVSWTPCREEADEDPQFEGLVVDDARGVLYAAQEATGIWRVPLERRLPAVVQVPPARLFERTRSFGQAYWAVPDDDEFSCEAEAPDSLPPGTIVAPGVPAAAGPRLEADAEGLAIYEGRGATGYLIASSQGDDTFHVYARRDPRVYIGSFQVEGAGETDGHEVVNARLRGFPFGLFVAQNGEAAGPVSEAPINGYEYDGSSQFKLLRWDAIASALGL
jgi:3-phytase